VITSMAERRGNGQKLKGLSLFSLRSCVRARLDGCVAQHVAVRLNTLAFLTGGPTGAQQTLCHEETILQSILLGYLVWCSSGGGSCRGRNKMS